MEDINLEDRIKRTENMVPYLGYDTSTDVLVMEVFRNQLAIMKSLKKQEEEWEAFKEERFLAQIK